jgi:hypothetical protein
VPARRLPLQQRQQRISKIRSKIDTRIMTIAPTMDSRRKAIPEIIALMPPPIAETTEPIV